jgi:hypothetical protein
LGVAVSGLNLAHPASQKPFAWGYSETWRELPSQFTFLQFVSRKSEMAKIDVFERQGCTTFTKI